MRRFLVLMGFGFFLVAGSMMTGCGGDLDNFQVDISETTTVPARTTFDEILGAALGFAGFEDFTFSKTKEFQNRDVKPEQVDSVKIVSFTLTVDSPDNGNFDWLESIRFYAQSKGRDRILIAEYPQVPNGKRSLELDVSSGVELKPYATASTMSITTEASGSKPQQETTVRATAVFDVDVRVEGIL